LAQGLAQLLGAVLAASQTKGCSVERSSVVFTRGLVLVALLAFALTTGACGSSSDQGVPGTASCTISQMVSLGGTMLSQRICEEASGLSAAQEQQLKQQCMVPGGGLGADAGITQQETFAAGPCPRDGALGGCRVVQGGMTSIAWYYQMGSFTSADIQQLCTNAGATFVAP
jgi:hypothetical protein